jgi:hypothetical protein
MALDLPQIEIKDVKVTKSGNEHTVTVTWANSGKLPVALDQAKRVKIVKEDRLILEFDKGLTKGHENAIVQITSPELYDKTIYGGYTEAGETKVSTFKVKVNQKDPVKATLKLLSTRGGYVEREMTLK